MTDTIYENKLYSIQKRISTMEWDMKMLKDSELLKIRQIQLQSLRSELQGLQKANSEKNPAR